MSHQIKSSRQQRIQREKTIVSTAIVLGLSLLALLVCNAWDTLSAIVHHLHLGF